MQNRELSLNSWKEASDDKSKSQTGLWSCCKKCIFYNKINMREEKKKNKKVCISNICKEKYAGIEPRICDLQLKCRTIYCIYLMYLDYNLL